MRSSGIVCVISGSISILWFMYQSTIFGTSVRPLAPPNAVPVHTRPVTSWNGRIEIYPDNLRCTHHARALNHIQPNAAEAEHHHARARLDFRGVDHRADAGGNAAADVTRLIERRVFPDFRHRDFGQHRVI